MIEEPVEEEEEPRVTNFNIPIKEIEKRFRALLKLIDVWVVSDCDHNHLGPFLGDLVDEFRQESRVRRRREGEEVEVTLHDRLLFIREVENGTLCWKIYKMWKRRGHDVSLGTLMVIYTLGRILKRRLCYQSGLLTPVQRESVELKAWKYKEKLPDKLQDKENVLKTTIGRGLLLISVSIIRYRCAEMQKISQLIHETYLAFMKI